MAKTGAKASKTPVKAKSAAVLEDVAKPGTTAASPTSKQIIVTHGPRVEDPMVVAPAETSEPEPATLSRSKTAPVLKPLKEESEEADEVGAPPEKTEASLETVEVKIDSKPDKAETKEPETPAEETETAEPEKPAADEDQEAETPEEAKQDQPDPAAAEKAAAAEQAEHDAAIQKLVDGKEYLLPINAVEQRKSQRFVLMGAVLVLLLAVVWIDLALDVGLIEIDGVKPVTHFFSN